MLEQLPQHLHAIKQMLQIVQHEQQLPVFEEIE
jgi:hypothetical protein